MDTPQTKPSPFAPAEQLPLHRNPPLAPSQELAYRKKCIQLKRRLVEIEANNDAIRRRISQEKNFQSKMRLNRAILLNHLKEVMETPGKKLSQEELNKLAAGTSGRGNLADAFGYNDQSAKKRPVGEYLLDDSSDDTEDDEIPEPQERPTRFKRANNTTGRDVIMANSGIVSSIPGNDGNGMYQQNSLQNIAPGPSAGSFSPDASKEPAMLTSSLRVSSTPVSTQTPIQSQYPIQQPVLNGPATYQPQLLQQGRIQTPNAVHGYPQSHDLIPPSSSIAQPVRPHPPFEQFTDHMTPQLQADNYLPDQIPSRIREEWTKLSDENRSLWNQRYQEQMVDYEHQMDQWKREQRRTMNGVGTGPGFPTAAR